MLPSMPRIAAAVRRWLVPSISHIKCSSMYVCQDIFLPVRCFSCSCSSSSMEIKHTLISEFERKRESLREKGMGGKEREWWAFKRRPRMTQGVNLWECCGGTWPRGFWSPFKLPIFCREFCSAWIHASVKFLLFLLSLRFAMGVVLLFLQST